jgi:ferritin-like metal-binding protein YciE
MKTLQDAFEHTLHDMYYAENAITKALPKVIAAVSNAPLKAALQHHLDETKGQIKTLDQVFRSISKAPKGEKCEAIEGLIKECEGLIEDAEGPVAKHALIIGITTRSRDTALCANGRKSLARRRPMTCFLKFSIKKKRPITR